MSPRAILLCALVSVLHILSVISIDFTCTDNECSCLSGDCSHSCDNLEENQCIDQYFICPSTSSSCLINCNGFESCKQLKFYGSPSSFNINCNGTNSCDGVEINCGKPDIISGDLSLRYTLSQFDGIMDYCQINVMTRNAMSFADISCDGSISNCIVNAYSDNSISQSLFTWYINNIILAHYRKQK